MATLMEALRAADAAGDVEAAQRFAKMIQAQQGQRQPQPTAQPTPQPAPVAQQDNQPSFGEQALGVAEAGAAIVGGGLGEFAGGLIGGTRGAIDLPPQEAQQLQEGVSDIFAFEPRTEEGKKKLRQIGENEFIKQIGDFVTEAERLGGEFGFELTQPIAEALGIPGIAGAGGAIGASIPAAILEIFPALKAGKLAAKAADAPIVKKAVDAPIETAKELIPEAAQAVKDVFEFETPTKKKLTELIQSGSTDIETARFELTPSPLRGGQRLKADALANETLKQGFDEGAIAAIKQASPIDKQKMSKMADIAENAKKNVKFGKTNRAADVLGDSLRDRFEIVKRANTVAGKEIGRISKGLEGKPIDLSDATANFSNKLDELGITLVDDGKGVTKVDFSQSKVGPGNRAPLNEVVRQMDLAGRGAIDGLSAHDLKRAIDEQVTFGKVKTGIGGRMEGALKAFRTDIDAALDGTFPEYNEANVQFSETIGALDELQRVAGKIDLFGENADKALGTLMRRVSGNAQSRINLLDSINEITDIARKYENVSVGPKRIGKETTKIGDDLLDQIVFVDELERKFGAAGTTSFQSQIQQGVEQAGKAILSPKTGLPAAALKGIGAAAEKARGINEKNAFKAIKDLLKEEK